MYVLIFKCGPLGCEETLEKGNLYPSLLGRLRTVGERTVSAEACFALGV